MQTRPEETGGSATATGKIWELVYKTHAVRRKGVERTRGGTRHGPAHAVIRVLHQHQRQHQIYTIVQTERDDYANTIQTIHAIIDSEREANRNEANRTGL